MSSVISALASAVRDPRALADAVRKEGAASVIARAEHSGVAGLVAHAAGPDLDPQLTALRRRLVLEEDLRFAELRRVVDALGTAGIRAVIMKGSALAYTHYPEPWCRTRADLDLLIARSDRAHAGAVLRTLRYAAGDLVSGTWLMQQDLWERDLAPGAVQMVDVHIELTNRAFFAARLRAPELLARAVPAPFAGPHGWQLDAIDALIYSCVHRVAHHSKDARLIWTSDIARQAATLSAADTLELMTRSHAMGLASVCAQELRGARADWGSDAGAFNARVIADLDRIGAKESSRAFLKDGRGRAHDIWLDLVSLPGWRARMQLIGEHMLPPREFMLRQPGATASNLPWRYVRRLLTGPFKRR